MSIKHSLLIAASAVLLSACAATSTPVIVAPQIDSKITPLYQQLPVQLSTRDLRSHQYLAQIKRSQQAAQLLGSQQPLSDVVQQSLSQLWQQQGLTVNSQQGKQIMVEITSALIDVNQENLQYQATNELALKVIVQRGDKTLSKTFSSHGSSSGPFSADIAVLERDFNQQLGQLLLNVVNNPELQAFIR